MKPVKLLTLTSRSYLVIFLVLLAISFCVLYVIIQKEVLNSTDEVLFNRKTHILEQLAKSESEIKDGVIEFTDFSMTNYPQGHGRPDKYSDTLVFETVDQELDEFRKLTTFTTLRGKLLKIEIFLPRLETHEIVEGIASSLLVIFFLIGIAFYAATWYLSKKLWQPFYDTLHKLNTFDVDDPKGLALRPARIEEFEALNKSIQGLTDRTRAAFANQKQFTENASHEMQTPLAITQSKLELLIEDPHLTQSQSEIIQTLINSTTRLARLNKTLLLLSKIENQQFLEKETVMLKNLIEETLTNFEEQQENLHITVERHIDSNTMLNANRVLVDLLVTNLIKNAFFHNQENGHVTIRVHDNHFSISNTSAGEFIPEGRLFQRFYKASNNKDSWGLGLAIIKKICDINQWSIVYSKEKTIHTFEVTFG